MSLRDFLTIPALIMFALGVFLAAWVRGVVGSARTKVSGA